LAKLQSLIVSSLKSLLVSNTDKAGSGGVNKNKFRSFTTPYYEAAFEKDGFPGFIT
jgi:hypothetical protein